VAFDGTAALSFAATIANSSVTYAKIQNVAAASVIGNSSASVAQAPQALSMATLAGMLSGQTMNIVGSSSSCTGNATTATNGFSVKPGWAFAENLIADLSNFNNSVPSGFYQYASATNSPGTSWYNLINVRHSNTGNDHGFQLAMSYYADVLWSRSYQGGTGANNGTFTTWRAHLHSGNFNSYALPLTGGTLSGVLTLVSSGTAINISGQSDSFGYNATAGQGTYIKGTGSTYIYGGGTFFDGTAVRTLLNSSNYTSYPDTTKLPLTGGAITGNSTFSADNHLTFGPNSSWSRSLRIGGNGYTAPATTTASVVTTNGNLHLDAAKAAGMGIYLNWYGGAGGTLFGNGSGTQVGIVDGSGNASFIGSLDMTAGPVNANGQLRTLSQVRATGWYNTPTGTSYTGLAAELGISAGEAYLLCYNRDAGGYGVLNIAGSASNLRISGSVFNLQTGSLQQGGNQVLHAGNYTSYTLPRGGSWYGANLPGTRWGGMTSAGGEIVFGQDLPAAGQMGILIDGCYIAAENNGFWSLASSNDWTTRRGMYFDGTYLRFDYNSATAYFSNASIGGNQVLHAGNYTSYPDTTKLPLAGGTLTGQVQLKAGHGDTRFQLYENYNNDTNHAQAAFLTLWASEPGLSWQNAGIGGNINNGGQYYGRAGTGNTYGVYLQFDVAAGESKFYNTTGAPGVAGGQGTLRAKIAADGEIYATASQYKVLHAGNYGGYSAFSGAISGTELTLSGQGMGAYNLMKYSGLRSGDWQTFTNTQGQLNVIQVNGISSGAHTNYPTGVYTYGAVMSWRTIEHSFQLYASHTGDLAYKTQWNNDNYSGWRRILDSTNYIHAANMNQYVRTTDNPTFNSVLITSEISISKNNPRNLLIQGSGGTDSGLLGRGSSGQFAFQLYGSGGGDYGFLDGAWAGWDIRKVTGGNLFLNNNNTYYLNPASLTNLLSLTVANTITGSITGNAGTATSLANFTNQSGARYTTDFNSIVTTGFFNAEATPTNSPGGSYGQLISVKGIDTGLQIYGGYVNDNLWFRGWHTSGGTFTAWRTVIHSGNIASQTVATAGSANAIADGVVSTTAKLANSVVTYAKIQNVTAYTVLGNSSPSSAQAPVEISMATLAGMVGNQYTTSIGNALPDRVFMSNDANIKFAPRDTAKAHLGLTGKYGNSRPNITGDTNYWTGSMGWAATDWNSVMDWGSGFTDSWDSPANRPGDTTHHCGVQSVHYTNGSARYGWQMVNGVATNRWWLRDVWGGGFSAWREILHSGNASYALAMNQSVGTGNSPSFTGLSVINTITGSVSGSSGSCTGNAASASSVAWTNVSGRPTAVSSFSNDSGYITSGGSISGSAGSVAASGITGQTGMWTSAARPGPYRLYRRDSDDAYSVQTYWTGSYWRLDGYYSNNTVHAGCNVAYADAAASSASCSGNAASVTDGVYLSTNQYISGVKTFSSAPVATNIAKAWVYYNMNTNTINASYNVSSVTDNGTGVCTVNFATAMVDANYVVAGTATYGYDDQDIHALTLAVPRRSTAQQAGSCRLATEYIHAAGVYDSVAVRAVFYR
jgi:hypothetical protein